MRLITRLFLSAGFAAALAAPLSVHAEEKPAASNNEVKVNPWSQCGIGAAIFKNVPWAAVISNVIWDLGTTALTSGLSSPNTCNGKDVAAAKFINDTYDNLADDTAKGSGDHISALLNIWGCDTQAHSEIAGSIRQDFARVIAVPEYSALNKQQKAQGYYAIGANAVHTKFAAQCNAA